MWGLGIEPESSARTASAISPLIDLSSFESLHLTSLSLLLVS